LKTVFGDQTESGAWAAWPETRQPIFGNSDERATAAATLAIMQVAAADDVAASAVRDKAVQWLIEKKSDDDPQSTALRLVLWRRLDKAADRWQPLVEQIKARQNADGGWSQTPEMQSDAWATGQALYALAHAGLNSQDPVIQRAQAFLVSSQRSDGSWPMTSRPIKPGGEGSKSLIPITAAGSSWAVMGLARSR
jgi:squalene cyclase